MGLSKAPVRGPAAHPLPPGYRRRLAGLHARALVGAVAAGGAVVIAAAAALVTLPTTWPFWLAAEALFVVVWLARKRLLDEVPDEHYSGPDGHCPVSAMQRFRQSVPVISRTCNSFDIIGRWFGHDNHDEIKRENVRELLAFGFGYRTAAEYEADGQGHVPDAIIAEMEASWGPYEEGHNPKLSFMAHLREPLRALHRPVGWYLFAEGLGGIKHAVLTAAGFRCERQAGFVYYTLGLPSAAAARAGAGAGPGDHEASPPIFFAHGVGLGLLPYLAFLLKLAALGRPVIAIEYPHLAMRWTHHIPTVDEGVAAMLGILDTYSLRRASFVGHSFGTFFMSRLNRVAPERVACMALIDPVCMCMWSGHLVRSFVYTPHKNKSGITTWFISRDIHTAAAVARRFFWSEYNMWPDQFPDNALVVLSGQDDLVPATHVASMVVHETDAHLMMIPDDKHAAFLFNLAWQREVLAGVWGLVSGTHRGGRRVPGDSVDSDGVGGGLGAARGADVAAVPGGCEGDSCEGEGSDADGSSPVASRDTPRSDGRRGSGHGHSDSAFSLSLSVSSLTSSSAELVTSEGAGGSETAAGEQQQQQEGDQAAGGGGGALSAGGLTKRVPRTGVEA